jgi:hypothetical protein
VGEFNENAKRAAQLLLAAGCNGPVPLETAAALLPTLKEWEQVAQSVGRKLRIRPTKKEARHG